MDGSSSLTVGMWSPSAEQKQVKEPSSGGDNGESFSQTWLTKGSCTAMESGTGHYHQFRKLKKKNYPKRCALGFTLTTIIT